MDTVRLTALYLCFFLSGAAGLVYEVLWEKYLGLFVGATGLAQVIVLSTFMGGLALGSHLFGRLADRVASPLKLYVFVEMAIGVYALLFDPVFDLSRGLFVQVVRASGLTAGSLVAAKVVACVTAVLIPTVLMGGTTPVLARYLIRQPGQIGPRISFLYFVNSLGAVVGCTVAGFFLIRTFGLRLSMVSGAALNIGVGVVALLVAEAERRAAGSAGSTAAVPAPAADADPAPEADTRVAAILLTAAAVSGAVSMLYEVAWIRLLTLVLGSSTYSFSLMLATFILGLALGGLLLSIRRRESGYDVIFGASEVLVGAAVLASLPFYARLPFAFNRIACTLSREPTTFALYEGSKILLCAAVMLVPTVLQGVTFPAAVKALTHNMAGLGRRVGLVLAVNTLGTLVGAAFAGFVGLPVLGMKGTLELAVVLNAAVGFAVLATGRDRRARRRALALTVPLLGAAAALYLAGLGSWDRDVLGYGTYRTRTRLASQADLTALARSRRTLFYRDGIDCTVAVQDMPGNPPDRVLVINGKADASSRGDLITQKMLAHLPLLCRPDSANVLIVGVGSGATIGSVLAYPGVRHVDVVELSHDVIAASRLFADVNGRYWEDPRVRVVWEDAKTFLQVTDRQYDVIISEPTNPWIAGIAGVFSREYFEECRQHLLPGGLLIQWLQAYETEDRTYLLVLDTFTATYPYLTLWNPARTDTVLVGSISPYRPDFGRLRALAADPGVAADLRLAGIGSPLALLAMQMADYATEATGVCWLGGAQHSDFFPILEYLAPRGFFVGGVAAAPRWLDQRLQPPAHARLWAAPYLATGTPAAADFEAAYTCARTQGWLCGDRAALAWAWAWHQAYPDDPAAREAFLTQYPPESTAAIIEALGPDASRADLHLHRTACALAFRDYLAQRNCLVAPDTTWLRGELDAVLQAADGRLDPNPRRWRGELLYDSGDPESAAADLRVAAEAMLPVPAYWSDLPDTAILLAKALLALDRPADARAALSRYLAAFPPNLRTHVLLARIEAAERQPRRP